MKNFKLNFLFLAIAIQLISCSSNQNWIVNIKIPNSKIKKAYLYTYDLSRDRTLIDSATVSNGAFQFSGLNKKDYNPQVYFFNFDKTGKGGAVFIVKNGDNLSVNYKGEYKITYAGNNYSKGLNKYFAVKQQGVDLLKKTISIYQNKALTTEQKQKEIAGLQKKMQAYEKNKLQVLASIKNPDIQSFLVLDEILTQSVIDKNIFEKYASLLHNDALKTKYGKRVGYIMSHFNAYKLYMDGGYNDFMTTKQKYEAMSKSDKASEFGVSVKKSLDKLEKLSLGKTPPDIIAKTIEGKAFDLRNIHAKLILVDFWASWCGPCRMENAHYKKLYKEFHGNGLTIISYSLDTDKNRWKNAVAKDGLNWINISNLKKRNDDSVLKAYQVQGIPANVLIKKGVIVARNLFGPELNNFIYNNL